MNRSVFMEYMKENVDSLGLVQENKEYKKINKEIEFLKKTLCLSLGEDTKEIFAKLEDQLIFLECLVSDLYFQIGFESAKYHGRLNEINKKDN